MPTPEATPRSHCSRGLTRRAFLGAGALAGSLGLTKADLSPARGSRDIRCILLVLVGGPSQLDTWDPKPNAPVDTRGPFRPIQTSVPGIHLTENFPCMARAAHRFAIVRSVHHTASP